jgi:transmembrane sensor
MCASSDQIEQQAAEWLARRDGQQWREADHEKLNAWLNTSTAHRVAYIRLAEAWRRALQLRDVPA